MKAIIAGIARHLITTVGGAGALEGVSEGDPVTTTVSVLFIAGGLIWSAIQKIKS